jgi:hypothetical protein
MTTEKQENLVELGDKVVGKIELPSIDVSPYVGKKVKVAQVLEYEGNYGYYIRISTEPVATDLKDKAGNILKNTKGEPIVLIATRMFGMQTDADGRIGWGEKTKLGVFLKKKGVSSYRELVGMEVITTSVTNSNDEKDYLSFN